MSKHFFYHRREAKLPKKEGELPYFETYVDSFNLDCVIRSHQVDENSLLVLLNDGHEESREIPLPQTSRTGETKRERQWIVSQIFLEGDDILNFRNALGYVPVPAATFESPQLSLFAKGEPTEIPNDN
jgi:hypothetical protein